MRRIHHRWLMTALLFMLNISLQSQSSEDYARAQEDFAIAAATAHARTSLFVAGSKPFTIHANVLSSLAIHGVGKGTYDNRWVDAQHWQRSIQFPDFEQSEMRNDAGHPWTDGSKDSMPLRIAEILRVVVLHVPGSNTASRLPVLKTTTTGDHGEPVSCYTVTHSTTFDGFVLQYRWCFDNGTGLLVSQDMPLHTHIVYSNYIPFQGKQEFTHVHVSAGNLPVLEIDLQYATLDAHALDDAAPGASMHRSESAESTPNPEDLQKASVEYRFNPMLPPGTPLALKDSPVVLHFHVGADSNLLDAAVEDAPTEGQAQAALQAAPQFTFTPFMIGGKRVSNHTLQSVWFRSGVDDQTDDTAVKQPSYLGSTNANAKSGAVPGVFRSKQPSFAFRYPGDFERVPQGELDEDLRNAGLPQHPVSQTGAACTTVLFRAQRLRHATGRADFLTMYELSPDCIFGVLDEGALKTISTDAANTLVGKWSEHSISKPKSFLVNGRRRFGAVSITGQSREDESMKGLVAATNVHGHVLIWTLLGPDDAVTQTLASCTLQIGSEEESYLPQISVTP